MIHIIVLIIEAILKMGFLIFLHEMGHYIMGVRLGWKPKLTFTRWGWMPAFAVVTRDVDIEINNKTDFLKWYRDLSSFAVMGSLLSIIGILGLHLLGLLSTDGAFGITLLFSSYGFWEATNIVVKGEET